MYFSYYPGLNIGWGTHLDPEFKSALPFIIIDAIIIIFSNYIDFIIMMIINVITYTVILIIMIKKQQFIFILCILSSWILHPARSITHFLLDHQTKEGSALDINNATLNADEERLGFTPRAFQADHYCLWVTSVRTTAGAIPIPQPATQQTLQLWSALSTTIMANKLNNLKGMVMPQKTSLTGNDLREWWC